MRPSSAGGSATIAVTPARSITVTSSTSAITAAQPVQYASRASSGESTNSTTRQARSSGSTSAAICGKRSMACARSGAANNAPPSATAFTATSTRAMTPRLRKSGSESG